MNNSYFLGFIIQIKILCSENFYRKENHFLGKPENFWTNNFFWETKKFLEIFFGAASWTDAWEKLKICRNFLKTENLSRFPEHFFYFVFIWLSPGCSLLSLCFISFSLHTSSELRRWYIWADAKSTPSHSSDIHFLGIIM